MLKRNSESTTNRDLTNDPFKHFDAFTAQNFKKHCGKRRDSMQEVNFSFMEIFTNLCLEVFEAVCHIYSVCGKELRTIFKLC